MVMFQVGYWATTVRSRRRGTEGDTRILIDCGNGVLANYQKFARIEDLSAVILTHLHSDHMSDMMVFIELLKVYAPSEPAEEYNRLNIPDVYSLNPIWRFPLPS